MGILKLNHVSMEFSKNVGSDHGNGWLHCPSPIRYDFPRVTQASSSRSHVPPMANRSRVQNFALKSQFFLPNKICRLCGHFSAAVDYGA